jgi:RNA polymerase sigma-32 factor
MGAIDTTDVQKANYRFMRGAMKAPMLTAKREQELARAWLRNGDEGAMHSLVSSHFRLVVSQAAQYARRYGLSFADLMQEGNVGLMQATSRFDPERGVRFSTYAIWWIRAAIQDFVLRNTSVVRMATTTADKRLFFNLRRLRARIASAGGGIGSEERAEIAVKLGVSLAAVDEMDARLSGPDQSIDMPIEAGDAAGWSDMLVDENPSPEAIVAERLEQQAQHRWIAEAVASLPTREAVIIRRRRLAERPETLEELGVELGVSKERVRQLERRALRRLREMLETSAALARVTL